MTAIEKNSDFFILKKGQIENPSITVIIPAYNSEEYIEECISSIRNQTIKQIEIIIVDDSSSDNTLAKALSLSADDNRISIIKTQKQSGSPGHGRNIGLFLAKAPYISFIDSDDWIDPDMLESLYKAASKDDSDICFLSGFTNHFDDKAQKRYYKQSYIGSNCELKGFHESFMLWDKLFKAEFLKSNNLTIETTAAAEEIPFIIKLYFYAKKSSVSKGNYGYHYRRLNPHSVTTNIRKNAYPSFEFKAWEPVDHWIKHENIPSEYIDIISLRKALSFNYALSIVHEDHKEKFSSEAAEYLKSIDFERISKIAKKLGYESPLESIKNICKKTPPPTKSKNIIFGPNWSTSNPYQKLLYNNLKDIHEIYATGFSPNQFSKEYLNSKKESCGILHLHWLHCFYDPLSTASVDNFIETLGHAKKLGYKIIWTAHNLLPHEASELTIDNHKRVRVAIIDQSDYILVHDDHAADNLKKTFEVPKEKLFITPHGLYDVEIKNESTEGKTGAKTRLGINKNNFTVLIIGRIRKYKGIERALRIFCHGQLGLIKNINLIIAGSPDDQDVDQEIRTFSSKFKNIKYIDRNVPDSELGELFMASDACLLPYEKSLTSGVAFLAISYKTPIISSYLPAFEQFIHDGFALGAKNDDELEQAIYYAAQSFSSGSIKRLFSSLHQSNLTNKYLWSNIVKLPPYTNLL